MRDLYRSAAYVKPECERSVPLAGVPQIPDDAEASIRLHGEWALSLEQMLRCDVAIWNFAAPEIRRRREAHLQRMPLDLYFARTPEQDMGPGGDDAL